MSANGLAKLVSVGAGNPAQLVEGFPGILKDLSLILGVPREVGTVGTCL